MGESLDHEIKILEGIGSLLGGNDEGDDSHIVSLKQNGKIKNARKVLMPTIASTSSSPWINEALRASSSSRQSSAFSHGRFPLRFKTVSPCLDAAVWRRWFVRV
ncbi:hypothetical protein [Alcanivorax sp. DP30]|uniref:hypothetical protein n=1 Tax=Alcanivorax sp. DP30 TaxID=2606217 RepID=UPI00136FEEBB|nr:hypothetical protein [Alcanivorax sp. DP30]MZR62707.1 hypothetical protein [Alcanivorax sp. DP30]